MTETEIIWWHYQNRVHALASFLVEIGEIHSCEDLLYMFEKPWKWDNEWRSYLDMRRVREEEFPRKDLCELSDIYYRNLEHLVGDAPREYIASHAGEEMGAAHLNAAAYELGG